MAQDSRHTLFYLSIITLLFTLTLHLSVLPADAGQVFKNQDLEKYGHSSKSDEDENVPADTEETPDKAPESVKEEMPKLDRFAVPYTAFEGTARRIIIPVTFNNSVTAPMLLDTGAPGMHISEKLAEKLGILDNDEGNLLISIGGIGGTIPAIFTIVDSIRVGRAEDSFIPTTIAPSISTHFEGLIGMDFMANYSIQIDTRKRRLIFNEIPERADMPAGHDESWWKITFHRFRLMRSAWMEYRDRLIRDDDGSERLESMIEFADRQYNEAEYLYNRLSVYASEHSVPLEWR